MRAGERTLPSNANPVTRVTRSTMPTGTREVVRPGDAATLGVVPRDASASGDEAMPTGSPYFAATPEVSSGW